MPTVALRSQVPSLESLIPPGDGTATGRIVQLILVITVLSVAPGLLIMVTCFTRFVIALSFLRAGLGLQTTPANLILISLALFMTFYVMAPTFDKAWQNGVKPLMENKINEQEAYARITAPFKTFMRANVREKDLKLFEDLASEKLGIRAGGRRGRAARADPRLHDLRAAARLRDRLSDRAAVPGHRHDRGDADHVDGHDDAAADRHIAAVQGAVFRADRRLESADRRPGALVPLDVRL